MKNALWLLAALVTLPALAHFPSPGTKAAPADPRYVGEPVRNADGSIKRSSSAVREFRRLFACPPTQKTTGACPGWAVDHPLPLACGYADRKENMQWLDTETKRAKDRWEMQVYCPHQYEHQRRRIAAALEAARHGRGVMP